MKDLAHSDTYEHIATKLRENLWCIWNMNLTISVNFILFEACVYIMYISQTF